MRLKAWFLAKYGVKARWITGGALLFLFFGVAWIAEMYPGIFQIASHSPMVSIIHHMDFVRIPAGTFDMGCGSWQTGCTEDEKPVHRVTLNDFELGKYEVTQGDYKAVMGNNPSYFKSCGEQCPVEQVLFHDVQVFLSRLNALNTGCHYRLPTEAEWEYACRAGQGQETYCGGTDLNVLAWYEGNSGGTTHPVGQKLPNSWGLHDMSGNVWEWTSDWFGETYYAHSPNSHNPTGPTHGTDHTERGGGWNNGPLSARTSNRRCCMPTPSHPPYNLGFRIVRVCS